jgi:hypothetical protein
VTYKSLAPKREYRLPTDNLGVTYISPPVEGMDYDDAYHEAKRIFLKLFGENEDFLVPDMMNDNVKDEDGE